MVDKKLSDLSINNVPAKDDLLYGIDVSETDLTLKSKAFTFGQIKPFYDVRDFGASRTGTPAANKAAIQAAIDAVSLVGGILLVLEPYPCASGLILKRNVWLMGNSPQSFKGTYPYGGGVAVKGNVPLPIPSGGAFVVTDKAGSTALSGAFLIMDCNSCVTGVSFVYPDNDMNTATPATSLIKYPPAIALRQDVYINNVRLQDINLVGCWIGVDFSNTIGCQDIWIDTLYGYPFSGRLLKINNCFDVPRISRCHVNPSSGMNLYHDGSSTAPNKNPAIEYVVENGEFSFQFSSFQQFSVSQCFVYGAAGGFYVEGNSWGSFNDCNVDCVTQGFYFKNIQLSSIQLAINTSMAWMSAGNNINKRNFITIDNCPGFFSICNAHAATGSNPEIDSSSTTIANSFLQIIGNAPNVSLVNCSTVGDWNKAIDANPSSTIKDFGNTWSSTLTQQSILTLSSLSLVIANLKLTDTTVVSTINGTPVTPTKIIRLSIGGTSYDIQATPSPVSSNPYQAIGWNYEFDARNINTSTDLIGGNVAQLKDSIVGLTMNQGTTANQFIYVASALDSQPCLRAVDGNAFLINTATSLNSPFTLLIALKPSAVNTTNSVPFMGNIASYNPAVFFTPTEINIYNGVSGSYLTKPTTNTADAVYVFAIVFNGTASKIYYNASVTNGTYNMSSVIGFTIGSFNQGDAAGRSNVGDYYKVLIANGELSKQQINDTVTQMKTERPSLAWTNLT